MRRTQPATLVSMVGKGTCIKEHQWHLERFSLRRNPAKGTQPCFTLEISDNLKAHKFVLLRLSISRWVATMARETYCSQERETKGKRQGTLPDRRELTRHGNYTWGLILQQKRNDQFPHGSSPPTATLVWETWHHPLAPGGTVHRWYAVLVTVPLLWRDTISRQFL